MITEYAREMVEPLVHREPHELLFCSESVDQSVDLAFLIYWQWLGYLNFTNEFYKRGTGSA